MGVRAAWTRGPGGWLPKDPADVPDRVRRGTWWLHVDSPEDVIPVARAHGADVTADAPGPRNRPHVQHLGDDGLLLVAPTLSYRAEGRDVLTGQVTLLRLDGLVVTAEIGDARVLEKVADRLTDGVLTPEGGAAQVLAALLITMVATAGEVEADLADGVADLEQQMVPAGGSAPVERLYALKRELAEARRALMPLSAELPDLLVDGDERTRAEPRWLRRLATAVERIDRHLADHDALLGDMLTAYLAEVSVRQNGDMRKISAWAAMIAVPTLVAGVYGMNFRHMPELHWVLGYPGAVALMVVSCLVLYRMFRRSGWL